MASGTIEYRSCKGTARFLFNVDENNGCNLRTAITRIAIPTVVLCLLFLHFSLSTVPAAPNSDSVLSTVPKIVGPRKLITVGTDQNYPPFEFLDKNGHPVGFNIDMLRALSDVMGVELEIRSGPWIAIRKALEEGRLDMVSGMYYSKERDKKVDFSIPFILIHESIFVRSDSSLSTIDELNNREVIVQSGDIMHDIATANGLMRKVIEVYSPLDALRLLSSGRHDAVLLPKIQGQYLLDTYSIDNVKSVGPAILVQEYCFAVIEGDTELVAILNQGLSILKTSGRYKEIREKWFGVIGRDRFEAVYQVGIPLFTLLVLLLAFSWLWNWSLRRHVHRKTKELAQELTAHEETFSSLKDREANLQAVVESSSDAILVLDRSFIMIDCNSAFSNELGFDKKEIINQQISLILPKEEAIEQLLKTVLDDILKIGTWRVEQLFQGKSGELVPMETTVSEIILRDGGLEGYVAIMRNITNRKRAEEENIRLEHQLRHIQKMEAIGTLAAGIAHDFNNILSSIIGYTELARRAIVEKNQVRQDLDDVLDSAEQAKELVRQILTYSRQTEQERHPEQLSALLEDSLRLLRASLPASIEINKDYAVEGDLILADATQINQVILNLVTNAVHAMNGARGRLGIKLRSIEVNEKTTPLVPPVRAGYYLELTITDNGHGIDASLIERIFDPFFTTKGRGEGTGMGLSVVHGIIKDHGGFIQVKSQLGVGTSFHVILPRFEGGTEISPPIGSIVGGNERLLLIDDDKKVANAWQRILMALGYSVTVATHPTHGLAYFQEKPTGFDLVLTDLDMPEMSGLELTQQLKKISPEIPVVLCTGFSSELNEADAKRLGVTQCLAKPVSTATMTETLRQILDEEQSK